LTGIEAISHHNGWAQAFVGATIVFSGLVILSFTISMISKILARLEERPIEEEPPAPSPEPTVSAIAIGDHCPANIGQVASIYQKLTEDLEEPFPLTRLYERALKEEFPHPHLSITCMRQAGRLTPKGEGLFSWN
jgi:Na+-transporting methylmalonyl-CoA/oxaloacetate decarboxylase gamma subunit